MALNGRRGSTILLVLAMLSILLLLAIAFSYGTRLETQASSNYAELEQARMSAATGLPLVAPLLVQASQGITTPQQAWSAVPTVLGSLMAPNDRSRTVSAAQMAELRKAGVSVRRDSDGQIESGPQATVQVRDLSGLVNLNAVDTEIAMQRLVQAVLPGGDPVRKSRAIMALRGDVLRPGTGGGSVRARSVGGEPETLDPRDPNAVLLENLARLRLNPDNGQPLFSQDEIDKLEKFVTVFSQAPEVYNLPDGTHVPKISLSAPIDPEDVFQRLKTAFPHKKRALLLQFAANLADYADEDDEPTILDSNGKKVEVVSGGIGRSDLTIGVEMVPMISEVYPDSKTGVQHGDDGQFVEISNPWSESISLSGWSIASSGGSRVSLTATLPPGGMLVVTDNLDKPMPDTPPGEGSLASIFGAMPDGGSKQVMTVPGFDLPDRNGQVTLYNSQGRMVDFFDYGAGNSVDGKSSFQRQDPVVRGYKVAEATPLTQSISMGNVAESRTAWDDGNTTVTKLSQLFKLSTGFVERGEAGQTVYPSQMAELTLPEEITPGSDPYPTNMDLRLIDMFTIAPPGKDEVAKADDSERDARQRGADRMREFRERLERLRRGESETDAETTMSTVFSYGKLNLNTCSKYALLGLDPGGAMAQTGGLSGMVEAFENRRVMRMRQGNVPFLNVSEFVAQFAPGLSRSNLSDLDKITEQVTVGSSAYEVVATNRLSPEQQKALESGNSTDGPRPATATAKWVISTDKEPYSIISFTLVP